MAKLFSAVAIFLVAVGSSFGQAPQYDLDAKAALALAAPPQCTLPELCDCGGACGCPVCDCFECNHVKQQPQLKLNPWREAKRRAATLDKPILIWRNWHSPYMESALDQFVHYRTQDRNEFGGGIGVTIAYRKKDGYWYTDSGLRISASSCSVKSIRDAWDKHQGTYRAEQYQPTQQMYSPSMMGGYGGGMMMYQSSPRFMFRGSGCSS